MYFVRCLHAGLSLAVVTACVYVEFVWLGMLPMPWGAS